MKINFSVRTFLIFLAVSFTMVPVVLFGVYEARSGVERTNQQASELNVEAALLIERDIALAIDRFKGVFEGLSAGVDLTTLRFRDEDRAKNVLKEYPQIATLFLLNKDAVIEINPQDCHFRHVSKPGNGTSRDSFQRSAARRRWLCTGIHRRRHSDRSVPRQL